MNLKISVVTPSYNQVELIERTIKSVLHQEYENLDYIINEGLFSKVDNLYLDRDALNQISSKQK